MPESYQLVLNIVTRVLLGLAVVTGIVVIIDWAIRARHINPFSGIARFFRRWIDPMLRPIETALVRRGGQPQHAPFLAFMIVIVTGIVLIQLMRLGAGLILQVQVGITSPTRFALMLVGWAFDFLVSALIVRVISSWLPLSPYSRWIRWSYVSTDWILAPLRRVIPPLGQVDLSPIVAYILIRVAGSILGV